MTGNSKLHAVAMLLAIAAGERRGEQKRQRTYCSKAHTDLFKD
jgi:hypothetical protein